MRSILDQLDGDDSVLLMYLSGELSPAEQARVDQRLRAEPSLRTRLDGLREVEDTIVATIRELDAAVPLPGSDSAAARQTGRVIRQWQARRIADAARPRPSAAKLRFPWWSYPLAAAAAVTLAFAVWFQVSDPSASTDDRVAGIMDRELADVEFAPGPYDTAQYALLEDPNDLSDLERELIAVRELRDWLQ